jgi:hypothetical protein
MTNIRLKTYFNKFYKENRVMLTCATLGLTIPLILRGSLDLFRHYDPKFDEMIAENIALYDSMIFSIGDVIPISFQLSSLIFGYIRNRKDKKTRLIVGRKESDLTEQYGRHKLMESCSTVLTENSYLTDQYFDPPLMAYIDSNSKIEVHVYDRDMESSNKFLYNVDNVNNSASIVMSPAI